MSKRLFPELLLLTRVAILLLVIRTALWVVPYSSLRWIVAFLATPTNTQGNHFSIEQLSKTVSTAARYVPRATCLTQALALHVLLKRRKLQSRIRVGVAKDEMGFLEAHAWVESGDRVVIGEPNLSHYTPMMVLD
jgi:hypothetical protein